MNILTLAMRNLTRRPLRSALSTLGVALAVGSALALVTLSGSIKESVRESSKEGGDDIVVVQKGASDVFGGAFPEAMVAKIAALPGVTRAGGEMFLLAPGEGDRGLLTVGWPADSYLWKQMPLREGRLPKPGERRVIVLGDTMARSLEAKVGESIALFGERFEVIGVANFATAMNRSSAYAIMADLQTGSLRPDQVSLVHVNVERAAGAVERAKKAIEALGGVSAIAPDEVLRNDRNFAILDAVSLAVAIIAIAMGALNILTALVMSTQERTREIGIMAAIGWSDGRIMASVVIEGLAMCAAGSIAGLGLSFLSAFAFPYIPAIGNLISFRPSLELIGQVFGGTFLLSAIGAFIPASRVVALSPALALRRI